MPLFCLHFWNIVFLGIELWVATYLSFPSIFCLYFFIDHWFLRSQRLILLRFFLVYNAPFCYGWLQDFVFIFVYTLLRIHGAPLKHTFSLLFFLLRLLFLKREEVDESSWQWILFFFLCQHHDGLLFGIFPSVLCESLVVYVEEKPTSQCNLLLYLWCFLLHTFMLTYIQLL